MNNSDNCNIPTSWWCNGKPRDKYATVVCQWPCRKRAKNHHVECKILFYPEGWLVNYDTHSKKKSCNHAYILSACVRTIHLNTQPTHMTTRSDTVVYCGNLYINPTKTVTANWQVSFSSIKIYNILTGEKMSNSRFHAEEIRAETTCSFWRNATWLCDFGVHSDYAHRKSLGCIP